MLKARNFGIFLKLLAAFLLIILPLFGSIFYLNGKAESDAYEALLESLKNKSAVFLDSMDTEFDRIRNLQQEFINNQDLLSLSMADNYMNAYEKYAALNRVQYNLQLIKNSNKYIKTSRVYLPSIDRMLQANLKYTEIDGEEYEAFTAGNLARGFVVFRGELFLTSRLPYRTNEGERQTTAIVLELDKQEMRNELDKLAAGGGAALIDDEWKWRVYDSAFERTDGVVERLRASAAGDPDSRDRKPFALDIGGTTYLALLHHSDAHNYNLFTFVPEKEAMGSLAKYNLWFWSLAAASVIIIVFFSLWIYRVIHNPLSRLVRAFRRLEVGHFDINMTYRGHDEFSYLYKQFNEMVVRLKQAIAEIYEQKLTVQRAELKQLQAQINPHFLYNTYFIMNQMVRTRDYDNLEPFSRHLGQYLQFVTRNIQEQIPLAQEVAFMRTYIDIQSIRFENRIEAEVGELPDKFRSLMVPRLLLQPIVENAYKHGLEKRAEGGYLRVRFRDEGNRLSIVIEDNGGIDDEGLARLQASLSERGDSDEITGIVNVHQRLKLKFGSGNGLAVDKNEEGGLRVTIAFPIEGEDKHV